MGIGQPVASFPYAAPTTNKQTLLLFLFTPTPQSHNCLLDGLAPGTVQPPQADFLPGKLPPGKHQWGEQENVWVQNPDRGL